MADTVKQVSPYSCHNTASVAPLYIVIFHKLHRYIRYPRNGEDKIPDRNSRYSQICIIMTMTRDMQAKTSRKLTRVLMGHPGTFGIFGNASGGRSRPWNGVSRHNKSGPYKCYRCQQTGVDDRRVYPTVYSLKRHIFSTHLHEKGFVLRCGIDSCPVEFKNRRSLSNHVAKSHPGSEWFPAPLQNNLSSTEQNPAPDVFDDHDGMDVDHNIAVEQASLTDDLEERVENNEHTCRGASFEIPYHANNSYVVPDTIEDEDVEVFKEMMAQSNENRQLATALSIAELKANYNLTQTATEAIQQWTEGLLSNIVHTFIGGIKLVNNVRDYGSTPVTLNDVFDLGHGQANPFHGLQSEWKLKKLLREKLGYIEPETVVLHEVLNEGREGEKKVYTMQYVPLLGVLRLLYQDKDFRNELIKRKPDSSGLMEDFMDGNYFKQHPLFSSNPFALQLQLYYDGFEVANPLGSKSQQHNVGALYFSILNLPPAYRSSLKSICLVGLFYEKDIKHPDIGWEVILQRFNSDLKELENGISFSVDGQTIFVQGTVAQCALDNKAAHSLFGLRDSFFGDYISRYCLCSSDDIQVRTSVSECCLRDRQTYDADLETLEQTGQSSNGVKTRCFLDSKYFHRADSYAADIHHDVFEGLIPGMLKPILKELILKKNVFTIQILNGRISSFDFNAQDSKNRPSLITEAKLREDSRSLKQYAAQYWCLLRKLPLLIGDLVPEGDEHWGLLIQLIDVVDLIMSPKVDGATLAYLQMELIVLFKEVKRLFPTLRITPKMHYILHYPRLMKEVGPLIRHWVMRYEAKHHYFKRAAVLCGNFINIPRTLAMRHQMLQVVHVHRGELLNKDVSLTDGHPIKIADTPLVKDIQRLLNEEQPTQCKKVTVQGIIYKEGDVLLSGFDNDGFIQLGEVKSIFVSSRRVVCFCLQMLHVLQYSNHFHSWEIDRPVDQQLIPLLHDSLLDNHQVGIHYTFGNFSSWYANLRYNVRYAEKL